MAQGVPNRFQTKTGYLPLSQLDANFDYVSAKWICANDAAYGATGDGVTDDSTAINNALANSPDGSIIGLLPGAYFVGTTITVPAGKMLMALGTGIGASDTQCNVRIIGALSLTPIVTISGGAAARQSSIQGIAITRAAGAVPSGSVGLLISGTDSPLIDGVTVYRSAIGVKCTGQLGINLNRVETTQITETHWWLENAIQVRATKCSFGKDGGLDVNCNEYLRIKGTCDTIWFSECQFNQSAGQVTNAVIFDTYTSANGIFTWSQCHFEKVTDMLAQTGTTNADRIGFYGCTINASGNFFGASITTNFCRDFKLVGSPFILPTFNMPGFTEGNVAANTFLSDFTFNAGASTVVGNTFTGNITVTGAHTGSVFSGNAITSSSKTLTNNATGFIRAYGNVINNASNDAAVVDTLKNISARSLALTTKLSLAHSTVTYSASMTPDASLGNIFIIVANNSTAFTINAPANPTVDQIITIRIANTSGGALGTATWDAVFRMATWTQPANSNSRSISFYYNSTNWIEISRTTSDIPN